MMIPNGNICVGHIFPWVERSDTHGYNKDYPQGDATHATHPHGTPTHIPGLLSPRGELPLAPTLHIVHQRNTQGLYQQNAPPVTPRSCRGDWEVARPSAWRTHAHSGVAVTADELPLAPTLHIVHQRNTQGLHRQKMHYVYIAPTLHVVNERNTSVLHAPTYCTWQYALRIMLHG